MRHVERKVTAANVPSIDGSWTIPHESPKGEKAWRFIVKQQGADATAAILRVDGDTGALTGTSEGGLSRGVELARRSSNLPGRSAWDCS